MTDALLARRGRARLAAAAVFAATLVACSILEPRPDPTRFFVLASGPTSGSSAVAGGEALPSFGVGPVTLPAYLERPELVRRTASHEIHPSRVERWAEPLETATMRVLAEDLSLLSSSSVVRYPWLPPASPSCQVAVELQRFEPVAGARVELVANVRLSRFDTGTSQPQRRQEISIALPADDGASVAAAMSEALLELARRIAAAAKELVGGR